MSWQLKSNGANPSTSAKKNLNRSRFDSGSFLSKPQGLVYHQGACTLYIITACGVYHQRLLPLYIITRKRAFNSLRFDDMHNYVVMICNSTSWWYAMLLHWYSRAEGLPISAGNGVIPPLPPYFARLIMSWQLKSNGANPVGIPECKQNLFGAFCFFVRFMRGRMGGKSALFAFSYMRIAHIFVDTLFWYD